MSGEISIESRLGVGSKFAAIIDGEQVARYILKGYLAATRFTVVEAASGQEGLRLALEGTNQPELPQ